MSDTLLVTFDFWIKAFIPKNVSLGSGKMYTQPVPGSPDLTMIPHPFNGKFALPMDGRTGMQDAAIEINSCYNTNNRGFSNDPLAKSKMTSRAKISIYRRDMRASCNTRESIGCTKTKRVEGGQANYCDPTFEYDCTTGRLLAEPTAADESRMRFSDATLYPDGRDFLKITFNFSGAASLPNSPAARIGGDIDYTGQVTIYERERKLSVRCWIDDFPAFEAYASINGNPGIALFQELLKEGSTVQNLTGLSGTEAKITGRRVGGTARETDNVIWLGWNKEKRCVQKELSAGEGGGQFRDTNRAAWGAGDDYRPATGQNVSAARMRLTRLHAASTSAEG